MNVILDAARTRPVIDHVRAATSEAHRRLEDSLDIVTRLADPQSRRGMIRRYAALHIPADAALAAELDSVDGLDFRDRSRAPLLREFTQMTSLPAFPRPASRAEALGLLYVLEGSTLGGRLILRALAERGVDDATLAFLDPYGAMTGARWRAFLTVLDRETRDDQGHIDDATRGAVRGFAHAEHVLCGSMP